MRKFSSNLGAKLLGVALFVSALPSAFAVVLSPGDTSVPLPGTTSALRPELAGLVLVDTIRPWTIMTPQGNITGRVQDRVVRENVSGTLDFYTRLFVDSVPDFPAPPFSGVIRTDRSSFAAFATDVDWRIDGLGNIPPTEASRTPDGSTVSFLFGGGRVNPTHLPGGSNFFFVKTNATEFNAQGSMLLSSVAGAPPPFTTSFAAYQPIPEPSAVALLLAGLAGVGVFALRRMR